MSRRSSCHTVRVVSCGVSIFYRLPSHGSLVFLLQPLPKTRLGSQLKTILLT